MLIQKKDSNPYDVLGVGRDAPANVIKSTYRRLALKHHPDKITVSPSSTLAEIEAAKIKASSRFAEISAAYEILSDSEKKRRLDHTLKYSDGLSSGGLFRTANPYMSRYSRSKRKNKPFVPTRDEESQDAAFSSSNYIFSTSVRHTSNTSDGLRKFVTVTTQVINGKKSIREETLYSNGKREVRINTNTGKNKSNLINDGIRVSAAPEEKKDDDSSEFVHDLWFKMTSFLCSPETISDKSSNQRSPLKENFQSNRVTQARPPMLTLSVSNFQCAHVGQGGRPTYSTRAAPLVSGFQF